MTAETDPQLADPAVVLEKFAEGWYDISKDYWARQETSVDGMLGGFRELTGVDVLDSSELISKYQSLRRDSLGTERIADCGCGIGRVAHFCLVDHFKEIHLVDPVEHFVDQAVETLKSDEGITTRKIVSGAQDFVPDCDYDAFWCQWAIMYLRDDDAISFLQRCAAKLRKGGVIFVKDNISDQNEKSKRSEAQFYEEDRGLCRAQCHYIELFERAGLKVVEAVRQQGWPEDLLPLYTFVLRRR